MILADHRDQTFAYGILNVECRFDLEEDGTCYELRGGNNQALNIFDRAHCHYESCREHRASLTCIVSEELVRISLSLDCSSRNDRSMREEESENKQIEGVS